MVALLDIRPIDRTRVIGVHGIKEVPVYLIDLHLPNDVTLQAIRATECDELDNDGSCTMLIGMDVMQHGDVAISNFQGKTMFSFRMPSQGKTDYVAIGQAEVERQNRLKANR